MKLYSICALLLAATIYIQTALADTPAGQADAATVKVTLLGTGGPEMSWNRQSMATLIQAGGEAYLFDSGRGVMQRLYETRTNPVNVRKIFYTHLHNDHIEGLPNLWMASWFLLGRTTPYDIWGPTGTQAMISGMQQMYQFDIQHRANAFNDPEALKIKVHEITGESVVYSNSTTRITAFPVEHHDGNPAYGYSFEHAGKRVVLSGDTTYHPNLVKYGDHADVIIQNIIAMSPEFEHKPEMQAVLAKLTTIRQAAKIFNATRPGLAVYSHIVKKGMSGSAGDKLLIARTRAESYLGPLLVGEDRTVIKLTDKIEVLPPADITELPDMDKKAKYAE